jgi:hypothetical protein
MRLPGIRSNKPLDRPPRATRNRRNQYLPGGEGLSALSSGQLVLEDRLAASPPRAGC